MIQPEQNTHTNGLNSPAPYLPKHPKRDTSGSLDSIAEVRDYSGNKWTQNDLGAYQERRKLLAALEKILACGRELFNFATVLLVTILSLLVLAQTGPAAAQVTGKTAAASRFEISYLAVFFIAGLAFFLLRTAEYLLNKAGLIKPEIDAKVDLIYEWVFSDQEGAKGAKSKILDLHRWHSPVETPEGQIHFPWKSKDHSTNAMLAELLSRIDHLADHLDRQSEESRIEARVQERLRSTKEHRAIPPIDRNG